MPTYEWKCQAESAVAEGAEPSVCGEEHILIRNHEQYRVPPEKCEKCGNADPAKWSKFISRPPSEKFGWGWAGKGNW